MTDFYANRVHVDTSSVGTGNLILGSAISGAYQSFSGAGVPEASTFPYTAYTTDQFECGHGSYSGGSLIRTAANVVAGSAGPEVLTNFSTQPRVFIGPLAETFAQDGDTLRVEAFNPTMGNDPSYRRPAEIISSFTEPNWNTSFSTCTALGIECYPQAGQNVYGGTTNAKTSFYNMALHMGSSGAGQRIMVNRVGNFYAHGDCAAEATHLTFWGGPIQGDEGQGYNLVSRLSQPWWLIQKTISSVPAQATINTTTTQSIVAGVSPQTVSVNNTTGLSVNQWVIIQQEFASGGDSLEAVQVTALTGSSITGVFRNNHPNGATVTPALVLVLDSVSELGEQRVLVNLSGTSYSTGSVASTSGGNFTGSGTSWTYGMVGGNTVNVGAIALESDDVTGGGLGSVVIKSWYQIIGVASTTSLAVHSMSVANDRAYRGRGGPSNYVIRAAARILRIDEDSSTVICETSTHTWTAGDTVEGIICPYPDLSGFQYHLGTFTPGGTRRAFMMAQNNGSARIETGFKLQSSMSGALSTEKAWGIGFHAENCFYGMRIDGAETANLVLDSTDTSKGKIAWAVRGEYVRAGDLTTIGGLEIACTDTNTTFTGMLRFYNKTATSNTANNATSVAQWCGLFTVLGIDANHPAGIRTQSYTVSTLPSAGNMGAGTMIFVSNEAGGAVLAFSDGTDWRRVTDRAVVS